MKENTLPANDAFRDALTPEELLDMAYQLQEEVTNGQLRNKLKNQYAIDSLLRAVIVLLKGKDGTDEYLRNRLHGAVGPLGFELQETPEERCYRDDPCPFHNHADDPFRARYLRRTAAD